MVRSRRGSGPVFFAARPVSFLAHVCSHAVEPAPPNCYVEAVTPTTWHDNRPENRRRSQRLRVRIRVVVRAQSPKKESITEEAEALVVNAHGGLLLMATEVRIDQFLTLVNPKTEEELLARITALGPRFMGKTEVAIEFIKPSPGFWGIRSKPDDWKYDPLYKPPQPTPQPKLRPRKS